MSAKLCPSLKFRAVNATTGAALAGGKVHTYEATSSTPKATYADTGAAAALTNPVILDSNGEAVIFLSSGFYKFTIADSSDVVQYSLDNVTADAPNVTGVVDIANGGTGQVTAAAAFNALSPMTDAGDIIIAGNGGVGTRLAKGTTTQVFHGGTVPSWSAVNLAADITGNLPVANGGSGETVLGAAYNADGAITTRNGSVVLTKGSAAAMTLLAPTVTTDDFKNLRIVSATAFAHTVTNVAPGFNGAGASKDVATFGGAVGDSMIVMAYQGVWLVLNLTNVTLG